MSLGAEKKYGPMGWARGPKQARLTSMDLLRWNTYVNFFNVIETVQSLTCINIRFQGI